MVVFRPRIAAADPAFFQHGDICKAMVFGQVIGTGQAVAAAAHDDGIVGAFWFRVAPRRFPAPVAGQAVADQIGKGILTHLKAQEKILPGFRMLLGSIMLFSCFIRLISAGLRETSK